MVVEPRHDAYGQLLLAALESDDVVEIVEREDGFISASVMGPKLYLAPFRRWPSHHRRAMRYAKGVCSMWEQERVASASTFRSAVRTSSRSTTLPARSLYVADVACETRVLAFDVVDESLGTFNTIVLSETISVCSARRQRRNNCSAGCTG